MGLWPSGTLRARQSPGELLRGEPSPPSRLGPGAGTSLKSMECAGECVAAADEDMGPLRRCSQLRGGRRLRAWL